MTATEHHRVYAQWQRIPDPSPTHVTVLFIGNGGAPTVQTAEAEIGGTYAEALTAIIEPIRENYDFLGWFTAPEGGTEVTAESAMPHTENHRVYARWQRSPITHVTALFIGNGGTPVAQTIEVEIGGTYAAALAAITTPVRSGHILIGWNTEPDGSGTEVSEETIVEEFDLRMLYAQWSRESVFFTNRHVYMIGVGGGRIDPHGSITRGGVATALKRVMSHESREVFWTRENPFYDVPNNGGTWYSNAVSTINASGLMTGQPGNVFGASQLITRAEMAVLVLGLIEVQIVHRSPDVSFLDVPEDHWAYEQIMQVARAGWMRGPGDGNFNPDASLSRAEFAYLMNGVLGRTIADIDTRNMIEWSDNTPGTWYYEALQIASNPTPGVQPLNWAALQQPYAIPHHLFDLS